MKHPSLMSDQTLFRDPDLFETFNYREARMNDLAFALSPAMRGSSPLNTVLRGPPGTGKTTAVRRACSTSWWSGPMAAATSASVSPRSGGRP